MLQVLVDTYLKSFVIEKRHGAMQKLFIKKEHKSVRDIENNRYLDVRLKKEMNKIAPIV